MLTFGGLNRKWQGPMGEASAQQEQQASRQHVRVEDSFVLLVLILSGLRSLPIGPIVVPFWGSYLESYKVIPKSNYYGAYG